MMYMVFLRNRYVGTVHANSADEARDIAACRYADGDDTDIDLALGGCH